MTSIPEFLNSSSQSVPDWMSDWLDRPETVTPKSVLDGFLGCRTVYYPGSGDDGHPVSLFSRSHAAHAFIYVDYGIRAADLIELINTKGFRGYDPVRRVNLSLQDFGGDVWAGDPPGMRPSRDFMIQDEPPYAFIQLFRRQEGLGEAHGARLFAILFLFADGHAAYEAIYVRRRSSIPPFAVVLQDHGFGGNWSPFGNGGCLHQIAQHAGQLPDFLLVAENTAPWTEYDLVRDQAGNLLMQSPGGMHNHMRALWFRRPTSPQVLLEGETEPDTDDNSDPIARAENLRKDGARYFLRGRFVEALELWRQAQALLSTPELINRVVVDVLMADLAMNEGNVLRSIGCLEEALAAYAQARDLHALPHLAARQDLDGDRATLSINEGDVLQSLGRLEEALTAYAQARDLYALPHLAARPELDKDRASLAMNAGAVLKSLGRTEEALASYERVSSISPDLASPSVL